MPRLELHTEVMYVKGVGPRVAQALAAKGIATVEDLLYYLPFRYEDRQNPRPIADLRPGEMASLIAEVRGSGLFRTRKMPIFEMTAGQGRSTVSCVWFHGSYLKDKFQPGQVVALYGRVEEDRRRGRVQMIQPQFEIIADSAEGGGEALFAEEAGAAQPRAAVSTQISLEMGRIVPVYESAGHGRLTSRWFRRVIHGALHNLAAQMPDPLPAALRRRLGLLPRREALEKVHWPPPDERFADLQGARTPAHIRLIFEELFFLQLGLELKRRRRRTRPGITFQLDAKVREAIKRILPFKPTVAQKRVLGEIAADMRQPSPMRRLLQGDVGSGKTIVALEAAIIAMENGYQAAIMAPTEILATQHYLAARRLLEPAGYRVLLLTGSLEPERKKAMRRRVARGDAQLVIGTHALIQEKVGFARLGLVVVDEQHRFGVLQRFKLMKKSGEAGERPVSAVAREPDARAKQRSVAEPSEKDPDVLVMTATPIPRTLALTLYGDLDVSILDEMPPGRTPITTRRVPDERSDEVFELVRKQAEAGHQAYVVYPVIEESAEEAAAGGAAGEAAAQGRAGLKAAVKMYDELRKRILPGLRIGLLHGRLDAEEKDAVMRRFQARELDVLVATTVIEVGVDVPNASVMVVEHAERFGLAQLHQLRGRIGRGAAKSYCILMTGKKVTPEAEQRLDCMVRTGDGFEIAELDLELRGPGEFFGTRQTGMPTLRVASLLRDRDLMELAKAEAARAAAGPSAELPEQELAHTMQHLRAHWQRRYGLVEVG